MRITYHGHSGFSVRTANRLLVFDWLGEGLAAPEPSDRAIVFASHSHGDHFHPLTVQWMREGRAVLITGDDVDAGGARMSPGDERQADGASVRAFGSTDQGVSFLVEADGARIFHAGDLNLWHWKHESTQEEIREAEAAFERVLETLAGERIDLAFFPVDPRMGEGYEEGALLFAERIRPGVLVPMHFWDQPQAALQMAERAMPGGVSVHAMTEPGESFEMN